MFRNVLLPVDLNHDASWRKALPMAQDLASGGRLHILGIVHDLGAAGMLASYLPPDFERQSLQHMQGALETFAGQHCPQAALHVGHGHVPETVLKAAADTGADLIVMASHPPDELRSLLVGSYADKVVRHAPIPVLVVR